MERTPYQCSVHTHTVFCDGRNTAEEMAAAAFALGVRHYGFSGHSHTPVPYDRDVGMALDLTDYRRELERLREVYRGRMEILWGIEQDSCSPQPVPDWLDYWIGSVHSIQDPETGTYYGMDYSREMLQRCARELCHGDMLAVTEAYYRDVGDMAERKPTILGHIDLVTKMNGDGSLFDEDCPRYRRAALEALHRADPAATLLEINTGAISRGYRKTPYPAPFLLEEWRRMGGRIILTADTHWADTILYGYALAAERARAAGFDSAVILTLDGAQDCAL